MPKKRLKDRQMVENNSAALHVVAARTVMFRHAVCKVVQRLTGEADGNQK
jgi:hypothetical protein